MKKIALGLLAAVIVFFIWQRFQIKDHKVTNKTSVEDQSSPQPTLVSSQISKTSVFVPYWDIDKAGDYDRYLYFGISATQNGIDKQEAGFTNLSQFTPNGRPAYLTLRMLDNETNLAVLKDESLQQKLINETVDIAQNGNFSGIVLDLELFSLFDEKVPKQINSFVEKLYRHSGERGLKLALTIYGDVFYRKRPFDVPTLAKNSDEIIIMAYDFHKSRGEPGPNFPLSGKEKWGYDFKTMISDFAKEVPVQKLTVAFGMFGYEWTVDEQGRPLKAATARTRSQIKDLLDSCGNCKINRDSMSAESYIEYPDSNKRKRILWYEDEESVKEKMKIMDENGIGSISYWAAGYF